MSECVERHRAFARLIEEQDAILVTAGFEPAEGGLWARNGVRFGRQAALQDARRELRERGGFADTDGKFFENPY